MNPIKTYRNSLRNYLKTIPLVGREKEKILPLINQYINLRKDKWEE